MKLNEMKEKLEQLEKIAYYNKSIQFMIIKKYLLEDRKEDDVDMLELTNNLLEQIIDLFMDYNMEDLMKWLDKNNYDPIIDFRYAEIYEYNELESEDLERLKDDCLFNDEENELLVVSW